MSSTKKKTKKKKQNAATDFRIPEISNDETDEDEENSQHASESEDYLSKGDSPRSEQIHKSTKQIFHDIKDDEDVKQTKKSHVVINIKHGLDESSHAINSLKQGNIHDQQTPINVAEKKMATKNYYESENNPLNPSASKSSDKSDSKEGGEQLDIQKGERVKCRNKDDEQWRYGDFGEEEYIKKKDGKFLIKHVKGFDTLEVWDEVSKFKKGEKVRCKDKDEKNWKSGVVDEVKDGLVFINNVSDFPSRMSLLWDEGDAETQREQERR